MSTSDGLTPWLSVIVPSYCGEEWIDTALCSLLAADGIEVIVIDGSPTSATREIAQRYSDRLRLRVFERCGLTSWQAKTNFGVQIAQSNHICWLGVDDVWLPKRADIVRNWIETAPDIQLHLAPSAIIGKAGEKLGAWRCPFPISGRLESTSVTDKLLVQNFVSAAAPIFRKDAWLGCGGLDENLWYTADWDMWLKLATIGPVYYHDVITVGFRIHADSLTMLGRRDAVDFENQMQIVLERHLRRLGKQSTALERTARASIAVNVALASAYAGDYRLSLTATWQVMKLGPFGIYRYFHSSRILERVAPRLWVKLTGGL